LLLLAVAGCTADPSGRPASPLDLPDLPPADDATEAACADLLEALPTEIDPGVVRRVVVAVAGRLAAYGEPPIVLRCGVPAPERIAERATVNGVEWSVRDSGAGFTWTTIGRETTLEVEIPDVYENFAELIVPLAAPVEAALPGTEPSPAAG
jgi:hypothetical protein